MRTQGFIRVRVNGGFYDIDEVPTLDRYKIHDIDAVVDRFRVRDDIALRLAESSEPPSIWVRAERLRTVGRLRYRRPCVSSQFACPHCGRRGRRTRTTAVFLQQPDRACPTCDGLGVDAFFDPTRVVQTPASVFPVALSAAGMPQCVLLPNAAGALGPYGFDLDLPFDKLDKKIQDVVLYGSGKEEITFEFKGDRSSVRRRVHPFEGILPNMERRYREIRVHGCARRAIEVLGHTSMPGLRRRSPQSSCTSRICREH